MSKFYEFMQNNSGGYYIENDDVGESIIIEENSERFAIAKMESITENYSEYCTCCGKRWCDYVWETYDDIESIRERELVYFRKGVIIYFLDGTKENIDFKEVY